MKKGLIYLLILLYLSAETVAQVPPSFYNATYGIPNLQDFSMTIKKCLNHYAISSSSAYPGIAPQISLYKYDSIGNQINSKTIGINNKALYSYRGNNLNFYNIDTSYYVSGVINQNFSGSSTTEAMLWKFNSNLDTLWHKSYKTPNDSTIGIGGSMIQNDGILLYGYSKQYDAKGDAIIIKTDFSGNELWRRTYQIPNISGNIGKLIATSDKGYIGIEILLEYPSWGYSDIKVVKYDSLFNVKWSVIYYTPYEDYLGDVIELRDSNLMFSQGLAVSQFNAPWGTVYSRQTLTKINKNNGVIIWQKSYGPTQAYIQLYNIFESLSKKIFVLGHNTTPYASKPSGTEISTLLVTNKNGDSLNYQSTFSDSVSKNNFLYDIAGTFDGFYCAGTTKLAVMTGTVITAWEQENWLVKADTNGCFNILCAQTIGISENNFQSNKDAFEVFPNPANNVINLKVPVLANVFDENKNIIIYDSKGAIIMKQKIERQNFSLDISQWTRGIYLVTVVENNVTLLKQKLLKE